MQIALSHWPLTREPQAPALVFSSTAPDPTCTSTSHRAIPFPMAHLPPPVIREWRSLAADADSVGLSHERGVIRFVSPDGAFGFINRNAAELNKPAAPDGGASVGSDGASAASGGASAASAAGGLAGAPGSNGGGGRRARGGHRDRDGGGGAGAGGSVYFNMSDAGEGEPQLQRGDVVEYVFLPAHHPGVLVDGVRYRSHSKGKACGLRLIHRPLPVPLPPSVAGAGGGVGFGSSAAAAAAAALHALGGPTAIMGRQRGASGGRNGNGSGNGNGRRRALHREDYFLGHEHAGPSRHHDAAPIDMMHHYADEHRTAGYGGPGQYYHHLDEYHRDGHHAEGSLYGPSYGLQSHGHPEDWPPHPQAALAASGAASGPHAAPGPYAAAVRAGLPELSHTLKPLVLGHEHYHQAPGATIGGAGAGGASPGLGHMGEPHLHPYRLPTAASAVTGVTAAPLQPPLPSQGGTARPGGASPAVPGPEPEPEPVGGAELEPQPSIDAGFGAAAPGAESDSTLPQAAVYASALAAASSAPRAVPAVGLIGIKPFLSPSVAGSFSSLTATGHGHGHAGPLSAFSGNGGGAGSGPGAAGSMSARTAMLAGGGSASGSASVGMHSARFGQSLYPQAGQSLPLQSSDVRVTAGVLGGFRSSQPHPQAHAAQPPLQSTMGAQLHAAQVHLQQSHQQTLPFLQPQRYHDAAAPVPGRHGPGFTSAFPSGGQTDYLGQPRSSPPLPPPQAPEATGGATASSRVGRPVGVGRGAVPTAASGPLPPYNPFARPQLQPHQAARYGGASAGMPVSVAGGASLIASGHHGMEPLAAADVAGPRFARDDAFIGHGAAAAQLHSGAPSSYYLQQAAAQAAAHAASVLQLHHDRSLDGDRGLAAQAPAHPTAPDTVMYPASEAATTADAAALLLRQLQLNPDEPLTGE